MVFRKIAAWLVPPGDSGNFRALAERSVVDHATDAAPEYPDTSQWLDRPPEPINELPTEQEILTETATVVIYDLEALAHRVDDDVDWWADPEPELQELKDRNLLILGVQADGFYDLDVSIGEPSDHQKFSLRFPSGMVFIGPGDVITGGGLQPNGHEGGFIISVEPGDYIVSVRRVRDERISIALNSGLRFENDVADPVTI